MRSLNQCLPLLGAEGSLSRLSFSRGAEKDLTAPCTLPYAVPWFCFGARVAIPLRKYHLTPSAHRAGQVVPRSERCAVPRGTVPRSCLGGGKAWGHVSLPLCPAPARGGGLLRAFDEQPPALVYPCYLQLMLSTAS